MTELEQKTQRIAAAFIEALTHQRHQGGWSGLAETKLNSVASLQTIQDSLQNLIKGKDESTVFRKSEYLMGQLFSEKFLNSSDRFEFTSAIKAILDRPFSVVESDRKSDRGLEVLEISSVNPTNAINPKNVVNSHQVIDVNPVIDVNLVKIQEKLKGMVLLDADQLSLDRETELELEKRTNCKILYRIAFANWKNKTSDRLLHERHYLLIHLPSGKDKTDGGMMIFGSSIQDHYPDVNCLFICSNDQIFIPLAMRVTQLGLQAYLLNQIGSEVHVKSLDGIESWTIKPQVPIAQLLERLKDIMGQKFGHRWILIEALEEEYFKEHGHPFQDDLAGREKYHSLLDFLKHYPKHFVVHQVQEEVAVVYVMLFQAAPPSILQNISTHQSTKKTILNDQSVSSTADPADDLTVNHSIVNAEIIQNSTAKDSGDLVKKFEQKLIKILQSLLANSYRKRSGEYISFTDLSSAFYQTYKVSINQASMEATQKRCILALSTSLFPTLAIKKQDKLWWVALK